MISDKMVDLVNKKYEINDYNIFNTFNSNNLLYSKNKTKNI